MKNKKYIFVAILITFLLSACGMGNTPTKKVEAFLNKYQTLDNVVLDQMDNMISTDTLMDSDQKNNYSDVLKRQYQDLTYQIKDERIDGDKAVVTAEVEVYDFYKTNNSSAKYYADNEDKFLNDDGILDESKYVEYRIEQMKNTMERVKYTIDFTLTKVNNKWTLDEIDDATRLKIHGLYEY